MDRHYLRSQIKGVLFIAFRTFFMTFWLFIVLLIICSSYLLEVVVSFLNVKALSPDLPEEFTDTLSPKEYLDSQEYTRATTFFTLIESSYTVSLTLLFIGFNGFQYLDVFARRYADNEICAGLLFTGTFLFFSFLAKLPFSIYFTFVIEERFGFNKTTYKTFILDILKSTVLIVLIGGPLLAVIFWFFIHAGPYGWLFCWIAVVVLSILLQYLAPVIILPLFNTFTPLPEGNLRNIILDYAQKQKFVIQDIFTMDGSKRSGKLNAFFIGFGKFKKIVFFDTLLEKLKENEVLAVLAHEMGHYKLNHILKMILASILQSGIMFFLLSLFLHTKGIGDAFGVEQPSVYASLVFFGFLYAPINLLVSILFHAMSRNHEFAADKYATMTTGSADMLITSLKKLSKANLANLTPHPLKVFIYYSHPPLLARIQRMRQHNSPIL